MNNIGTSIFTAEQAGRIMGSRHVNMSLARWEKRGEIRRLKRGLYIVANKPTDELVVANYIYQPSYVSLETVLNHSGVMPDVSGVTTSVVTGKPRKFDNEMGNFVYSRVSRELFFGYELVRDVKSGILIMIATPEKALLDYMYVRRVRRLDDARIEWDNLRKTVLLDMARSYPPWVKNSVKKYAQWKKRTRSIL